LLRFVRYVTLRFVQHETKKQTKSQKKKKKEKRNIKTFSTCIYLVNPKNPPPQNSLATKRRQLCWPFFTKF